MALGSSPFSIRIQIDKKTLRSTLGPLKKVRSKGYLRKAVRPGVNKAATILNKEMKAQAKGVGDQSFGYASSGDELIVSPKGLSKSIGIRRKTYAKTDWVIAVVGPRFDYISKEGDSNISVAPSKFAVFIEGMLPSDSMVRGATPFARPSARKSVNAMKRVFIRSLKTGTAKVLGKLRSKGVKI